MKRRTILILLGVVITILVSSLIVFFYINLKENANPIEPPNEVVELETIEGYDYRLEDRDTEIYKKTFESLRTVLQSEEIDYREYAKLLAELYIIDLYTLNNKMNLYDVGSLDFVLESAREDFAEKAKDTLYRYVEDNSYGKREQELPEVASIGTSDAETTQVKVGNNTYDGYKLQVTWNYVKDLGYDTEAKITIVRIENKLYVTSQSAS